MISFLKFQCPSFLLVIFRGRKQYISSAVCISLQYFAWCIPHTIPVFVGLYPPAYQPLPPKTNTVCAKMGVVVNLQYSGLCWLNRMCLTIWNLQEPSVYCSLLAVAQLRLTSWNIRKDSISHLASVTSADGFASTEGSRGLGSQAVGPALARKVGRPTDYDEVAPCLHFLAPSLGFRVRVWKCLVFEIMHIQWPKKESKIGCSFPG